MSDTPVQLIIAAFPSVTAAEEVLEQLKTAKKEKLIGHSGGPSADQG
jgi:uncharacterized membrane protein